MQARRVLLFFCLFSVHVFSLSANASLNDEDELLVFSEMAPVPQDSPEATPAAPAAQPSVVPVATTPATPAPAPNDVVINNNAVTTVRPSEPRVIPHDLKKAHHDNHDHHAHHNKKTNNVSPHIPGLNPPIKPGETLPQALFKHENVEDIVSEERKSPNFAIKKRNGTFTISGKYRPESFYGKSIALFNGCNPFDKVFYIRHTIDVNLNAQCGHKRYDYNASELKFTLRNKGVWGNPASIAPTTEVSIKDIDAKFGAHKHSLGRHVLWVREVWLKTLLNAALDIDSDKKHYLTLGYYPFKLGHGISLGEAYAVNPGLLGFYTDNVIDQFAPGIVLNGELIKDALDYDIYYAMFENKSDSLTNNSEPIYTQRYGRRNNPERGFGSINWLLAGRFQWVALKDKKHGTLEFEPYILYNSAPEQKIEFTGDSATKLCTLGLAADYANGGFEFSFEGARNLGEQKVFGWDRNQIVTELDPVTADVRHVNSHVLNLDGTKALYIKSNQAIINNSTQAQAANGQLISASLRNSDNRFNDPYCTPFRGWMAIADAGYWAWDRQLQVAVAAGIATGDENPNINLDNPKVSPGDGYFDGFIGLQEVYSGDRVESALFLGQRISRPLSLPDDALNTGLFASAVTGFTNLVYAGTGLHVKPNWKRKPYWRPNLLFFWQEDATRAFDCRKKARSCKDARNFLGTELNSFFNITFAECVGATVVAAIFIPGGHYADITGTPLNKDQVKVLLNETPDVASQFLLNSDPAFLLNLVLEYKF